MFQGVMMRSQVQGCLCLCVQCVQSMCTQKLEQFNMSPTWNVQRDDLTHSIEISSHVDLMCLPLQCHFRLNIHYTCTQAHTGSPQCGINEVARQEFRVESVLPPVAPPNPTLHATRSVRWCTAVQSCLRQWHWHPRAPARGRGGSPHCRGLAFRVGVCDARFGGSSAVG